VILLFIFMGSTAGPTDVSLQEIRAEKEAQGKTKAGALAVMLPAWIAYPAQGSNLSWWGCVTYWWVTAR
jgi:hypothetical protein